MAKQALGIYSWGEVIQWTDTEIKRLGWTKEQAQDHLFKNYGKRSRALLSDEAILDYLQRLRRLESIEAIATTELLGSPSKQ